MNFEIFVSREHDHYRAVCPAFPGCVGEGVSEAEATEDLGNIITLHLSDTVRKTIDDVRQLGLLHRVAALPEEQKSSSIPEPDISIKLKAQDEAREMFGKFLFSGKLPISQDLIRSFDKKHLGTRIRKILGVGGIPGMLGLPPMLDDLQMPFQAELVDEGLSFGVPMSLN